METIRQDLSSWRHKTWIPASLLWPAVRARTSLISFQKVLSLSTQGSIWEKTSREVSTSHTKQEQLIQMLVVATPNSNGRVGPARLISQLKIWPWYSRLTRLLLTALEWRRSIGIVSREVHRIFKRNLQLLSIRTLSPTWSTKWPNIKIS